MSADDDAAPGADRAIAIVGVACRLPGGISRLDQLWSALVQGKDLVGHVPPDRFETDRFVDTAMPRAGKSYTHAGGFLDDIAGFDAAYFGISPKEAAHMDPQHRMLPELTAEAVDDAAVDPSSLAGSDTAVYIGISDTSYGALQMSMLRSVNAYTMSGAAASIAANRLSHAFDLRGPSMSIDTACSSSLVALDRACRTLREGTSRTAVCGGANVLLSPYHYVGFSQASMLSLRGRCASFSARADGFVRAEGGAVVLLKRLRDALADGDRVRAVILGSGVNSDGRTVGLALPNPQAQEDLLRQVYAEAGVHPDELVYFEAHGTGTPVGDPLETMAVGRALGMRRVTGVLPIGSVKSNLGHLEPASGMAGLCKALLVLEHRMAPASLHAEPPHPDIDFTGLGLTPVTENRPLPGVERPVVGVSSYGFGGANAHAILAPAPPLPAPRDCAQPPEGLPVLVSARSGAALKQAAASIADRLARAAEEEFYDIASTSCLRRGRHGHRAVVLAHTPAEAARQFTALADGAGPQEPSPAAELPAEADTDADAETAARNAPAHHQPPAAGARAEAVKTGRVAFVFTGNGSQWAGMGADLLAHDEVFRSTVTSVDAELAPLLGWSVAEAMAAPPGQWRLSATEITQPLLFALQLGVVAVLRSRGIEPASVLGHSVGEVAAAHTAGALSLPQAAQVIAERSTAQAATAGCGRMAAVGLSPRQAEDALAPYNGLLEIAGLNSPHDVTVAGDATALAALGKDLERRDVFFRDLGLDYAFHSRSMDGQEERITTRLAGLSPSPLTIPLHSTVTGARASGLDLGAPYWWHNIRRPVRFAEAVERALEDGADVLLEIGPHPALATYLRRCTADRPQQTVAVLPTLRRDAGGPAALSTASAALIAAGAALARDRYFPRPGRVADLPAYPWQRERHWNGTPQTWVHSSGSGVIEHPLLGERMPAPLPAWEGAVEPVLVPWLADHRVAGSVVMPATGFAETAAAAGRAVLGGPVEVEHLDILSALVVPWPDASRVRTQVSLSPDDGVVTITSTDGRAGEPRLHARAQVRALLRRRPAPLDVDALRRECPRLIEDEEHYAACTAAGLTYGPVFRVLRHLRAGDGQVLAAYRHDAPGDPYTAHPAVLDGALQAGAPLLARYVADGHAYLPAAIAAVRVWSTPATTGFVRVRERSHIGNEVCWDIVLTDEDGTVTAQLDGCRLRRLAVPNRLPVATHHTVLRAAPHPETPCGPSPLPSPRRIEEAVRHRIAEVIAGWQKLGEQHTSDVKKLTAGRIAAVIAGILADPTEPFSLDDLIERGVQERHRRMLLLALPMLRNHGLVVAEDGERWRLSAERPDLDAFHEYVVARTPAHIAETSLAAYQSEHFADVLRGTEEATELLVRDPVARALEQLYDIAPSGRLHRLVQTLLREIAHRWPRDRTLRVLEIGAGTGGATAALLPLLPPARTRYCFSDISPFFFSRAQKRFEQYDFVHYETFDLDADPVGQGFPAAGFDLVVAANSLHTAKDLDFALRNVATLLAPGGMLLAVESHDPEILLPLFGTLDSFFGNTDTGLRPHCVLLPRDEWPILLAQCGYTEVVQTGDDRAPDRDHFSVILASVAADAPQPEEPPLPAPRADTAYVVVGETPDEEPLVQAVAEILTGHGSGPVHAVADGTGQTGWEPLLTFEERSAPGASPVGTISVVLVLGHAPQSDPGELVVRATRHAQTLCSLLEARRQLPHGVRTELWLVTGPAGAVPVPEETTDAADAIPWGVARCLFNEQPDLDSRRISLHRSGDVAADARRLVRELLEPTDEDEIVLTAGGRFVPRMTERSTARPADGTRPFTLRVRNPGLTYRLAWEETVPPEPRPGEVAVEVRAAGLNYRDILQTVGLLPAEHSEAAHGPAVLGLECAGVVTSCGPGVSGIEPGDRVAGLAIASLSSHTVADARTVWPVPDHMTFAEAATMPVAFATVHYGLVTLARLQPGETVLVHGAAGGVGLAALQYAKAYGARVIATAGTDFKRTFLRRLGIEHVLDSRTLDFAHRIEEITGGKGVDVVLNSLAGEALARSLQLLRPGGRFVELGKRDIHENKPPRLHPFANNIAFFGVDLTKVMDDPRRIDALVSDVNEAVLRSTFHPLPHSVYPAARVEEAFRLLQHSRHIGKVVVAFDPLDEPPLVEPRPRPFRLNPEGTYLVTGGTGGFGAATAEWLADLGARHLALVSRRGADAPEAAGVLARLAGRGVTATAYAADATDLEAMRAVVREIDLGGHPLRGTAHCAMDLDDDVLTDLGPERFAAVLAPKAAGAAVLDLLTRDRECDLFLLHSSLSATYGTVRQAPYAAGNLFLEALARRRHQAGASATAIAWGSISETGYVARHGLEDSLRTLGLEPISPSEAFAAGRGLLADHADVALVARSDFARAAALLPLFGRARLRDLAPARGEHDGLTTDELLSTVGRMTGEEALAFVADNLAKLIAEVLHMDPGQLDHHRRLDEYGMDSLMATELLLSLRRRFGVEIPPMELLRSNGTIADLAQLVTLRLGLGRPAQEGAVPTPRHAPEEIPPGAAPLRDDDGTTDQRHPVG
ncbi:SDR family NAD(P)-dependent oxidoreductase [Streptomyces rectiverticillatus]|uniref:type I polyketide synthase n=1 Tax=Streptomyces rectiverticillatus TaxID=173860 RepID=UPI0015C2E99C|nr:type I polyketide synthase [Streptomyces rectiverticillatus]QLE70944.1 SDR family NAD(P)-dependent oxidoreductase [Streptomyces rectiverticillatus]